ncbi:MAG: hypothetical protein ABR553_03595 [Gammaproteobacteria bacterium]
MRKLFSRLIQSLTLLSLISCQQGRSVSSFSMTDELKQDLATLQTARGYFGHQSVGGDIMDGLADILRDSGTPLPVLERGTPALPPGGFLLHMPVGKNTEPTSKCDDFRRIIDQELAGKIDYALLKFCYIDILEDTDVDALFGYYRDVLDGLKARHPDITFIHVTTALRDTPGGFGVWIRETIGKPNRAKLANIKRHAFNQRLRSTYAEDPIFDLAASESTYPDGSREAFTQDGNTYYSLIGAYTHDGGHLNELGRQHVAADFIRSLAAALRARAPAGQR